MWYGLDGSSPKVCQACVGQGRSVDIIGTTGSTIWLLCNALDFSLGPEKFRILICSQMRHACMMVKSLELNSA